MGVAGLQQVDVATLRAMLEQQIADGHLSMPVLPDVAVRLKQAATDTVADADGLARILTLDPGMSARVLKMSNSAMFAGRLEIRTLNQAISRLGASMTVAVVMGAAAREVFDSDTPEYRRLLSDTWRAALFAAAAARILSVRVGLVPQELFLAGLLHGCGDSVLVEATESLARDGRLVPRPGVELLAEAIVPISPAAGADVLATWSLPQSLVAAVRFRLDPDAAPAEYRSTAAMIGIVSEIGRALARGASPEEAAAAVEAHPSAERLDLDAATLVDLATRAEAEGSDMVGSL